MAKDLKAKECRIRQVVRTGGRVIMGEDEPLKKSAPRKEAAPVDQVDEGDSNVDES